MTSNTTLQIIEQLKDSSHPSIVLLDGAWGIGKTHLIENELQPIIKSRNKEFGDYHYISAFGIKSVTEFQDQIVSLYISNQKDGSEYLKTLANYSGKLARLCGSSSDESGIIKGVISGTTGYLRQNAIQNLKDITLVVDDLERLTDEKLIADIMGTCLRFAEQNQIKIIVVANANAFTDKSKVEKSFSDVIRFTRTTDELLTVISQIYDGKLDPMIEDSFFRTLNHARSNNIIINNLRVLQRAINRIIKLTKKIQSIECIDKNRSIEKLTQHIVLITLYCYSNALDRDGFVSIVESKDKWRAHRLTATKAKQQSVNKVEAPLPDEKQKQKDLFDQLTTLLGQGPRMSC